MAAPTRESPFQTVVLQHDLPDGTSHYDWLLSVDSGAEKPLISFRCDERPDLFDDYVWVNLESRPDHRPDYLNIEGKLEGNRGSVKRLTKGNIFLWKEVQGGWNLMVKWDGGSLCEYEFVSKQGILVFRRILESRSQDPPPPLPEPAIDVRVGGDEEPLALSRKITAFGSGKKKESKWGRAPNTTGSGAIHVRTFHSKLTDDALGYIDTQINEWLDEHPEFEVKIVTTTIGTFTGKIKEPHLICQVWV